MPLEKNPPIATTYFYTDGLETDRLLTRFLVPDDFKIWASFFTDPESIRFLKPSDVSPLERAKLWVNRQLNRYQQKEFGLQALIDKKTSAFIGQCGLLFQEIDEQNELEIGYHLLKEHRHQGYATEAAQLFRDYAFQHNLAPSVVSIIHTGNFASQQVATNNGLTLEKETNYFGDAVYVYRITKEQWLELKKPDRKL